jgi:hypothetical protein
LIAELSLPGETVDYAPKLTADGLEIFFTRFAGGGRSMWHARRTSRDAAFGAPSALIMEGPTTQDSIPMPSADGLTVFFARYRGESWTVHAARRESRSTLTFGAPVAIEALTAAPYSVVAIVSEETREVFLLSDRPRTPSAIGIWRAEICRDGACPARALDCPAPGVRSPDGLHCYVAADGGSRTRAAADSACAILGAHAPTLHSEAERALVWSGFSRLGAFWLAGSDAVTEGRWSWSTGEPWTFGPWGNVQPDDCRCFGGELEGGEDCAELNDGNGATWGYAHTPAGTMNDLACGVTRPVVCETDLWPTW